MGQPWQRDLDGALDRFVELMRKEETYWTEYQERVNQAIENEFDVVYAFRDEAQEEPS